MSKRGKKRVAFATNVRVRRIRVILSDIAIDLTTDATNCDFGASMVEQNEYELRFQPPLTKAEGANSHIQITHMQSKRRDVCLVVLPTTSEKQVREIGGHTYLSFPSHAIRFTADCLSVDRLYVTLTNEQLNGNDSTPIYATTFRYSLDRFHPLEYYPPIDYADIPMDATVFPQRVSMKFKKPNHNSISASAVPKLLGWYPQESQISASPHKLAAMRFGIMREMVGVALYLHEYPDYQAYQAGFYETDDFKAQPDILVNEDGCAEIKCSRSHCNFEGAHIAQSVATMAACNRSWIDLFKYCESPVKDTDTNKWITRKTFRVARFVRNKELEDSLKSLSRSGSDLRSSEHLRKQFDDLAAAATAQTPEKEADNAVIEQLFTQKKQYFQLQALDTDSIDPVLDAIECRQARIFAAYNEGQTTELNREIRDQLHSYLDLMGK